MSTVEKNVQKESGGSSTFYQDYLNLIQNGQKQSKKPFVYVQTSHVKGDKKREELTFVWRPEEPKKADEYRESINLWTYWQGVDAFSGGKKPYIRYLLVGQDWGSVDENDPYYRVVRENIRAIRRGDEDV